MSEKKKVQKGQNRQTVRRILRYIRPYAPLVALSLFLSLLTVALTLYIPILTGRSVDFIVGTGQVNFTGLFAVIVAILISVCVTALAQWVMSHINNKITYSIVRDLRVEAFNRLQELPLSYVDKHSSGDLISRIVTDIDQFSDGLLLGFTQLFSGVITILGTIAFMLSISPLVTLIVVLLSPLSFLVANFVSKRTYTMFRMQSQSRGELTGYTNEMLGGIKVVGAFNYQEEADRRFDELNKNLSDVSLKATFYSSITNPTTRFLYAVIYAGVAIAGGFSAIAGKSRSASFPVFSVIPINIPSRSMRLPACLPSSRIPSPRPRGFLNCSTSPPKRPKRKMPWCFPIREGRSNFPMSHFPICPKNRSLKISICRSDRDSGLPLSGPPVAEKPRLSIC